MFQLFTNIFFEHSLPLLQRNTHGIFRDGGKSPADAFAFITVFIIPNIYIRKIIISFDYLILFCTFDTANRKVI